ncbi:MAG: hypothetical protein ACTSQ8_07975 [Candidatus Helarchaeota archaeon]
MSKYIVCWRYFKKDEEGICHDAWKFFADKSEANQFFNRIKKTKTIVNVHLTKVIKDE